MRVNVYSIFDVAAGVYQRPFFCQADGEAMRAFGDLCMDAEHPVGKHPHDYSLFRIGTYDDNKGALVGEAPECMANGLEMVARARSIDRGELDAFEAELKSVSPGGTA